MLNSRNILFFFISAALVPALLPAQRTRGEPADTRPLVAILPIDSTPGDSARTIIQRDLDYGDRVVPVYLDPGLASSVGPRGSDIINYSFLAPTRATSLIRAVPIPAGYRVGLHDVSLGYVRQSADFRVPRVPARRAALVRDSIARDFFTRDSIARMALWRDSLLIDSLAREAAKPVKISRLHRKRDRLRADSVAAVRAVIRRQIQARDSVIRLIVRRDRIRNDSVLPVLLRRDSLLRDSLIIENRLAIHGMADEIERWLTGTRGTAQTRVAYVAAGKLRVVDSDGANDHIVRTPGAVLSPSWHPSGRKIVYADFNDNGTQIAQVDLHGNWQLLSQSRRGFNITPVYTPDGRSIVWSRGGDYFADLVVASATDSSPARSLTGGSEFENTSPAFSPDGRLAFVSPRPGLTPQIYSMFAEGGAARPLIPIPSGIRSYRTSPSWAPTGGAIAYQQQEGDFQVYMMDLLTRSLRRLTSYRENEDPSFAPDGRHMSITSTRGGPRQIWVLDSRTARFRQLTTTPDGRLSDWSPITRPLF